MLRYNSCRHGETGRWWEEGSPPVKMPTALSPAKLISIEQREGGRGDGGTGRGKQPPTTLRGQQVLQGLPRLFPHTSLERTTGSLDALKGLYGKVATQEYIKMSRL